MDKGTLLVAAAYAAVVGAYVHLAPTPPRAATAPPSRVAPMSAAPVTGDGARAVPLPQPVEPTAAESDFMAAIGEDAAAALRRDVFARLGDGWLVKLGVVADEMLPIGADQIAPLLGAGTPAWLDDAPGRVAHGGGAGAAAAVLGSYDLPTAGPGRTYAFGGGGGGGAGGGGGLGSVGDVLREPRAPAGAFYEAVRPRAPLYAVSGSAPVTYVPAPGAVSGQVVPLPAAVWSGAALFGAIGAWTRFRRRRASAEL
jgi:hypothetical protein